jgi:N-acetyl-alpha-D-muramate 1-phosphate uridylyltransferase
VVINTAWLGDMIPAALGAGGQYGLAITYSHERPEALETGGGIFQALPLLGSGPFLLVNGDVWTDVDLGALRRDPPEGSLAHLVLVRNPPQHPRGDFCLAEGPGGGAVSEGEGLRHTYSGVGIYRPEFFAGCTPGKFPLLPLLRRAIAQRALSGELHAGRWYDIGTAERLAALDAELSRH